MLLAGDEIGHSQQGNNNAYCQDNETSWLDWAAADHDLLACLQHLVALRAALPALRQEGWLHGPAAAGDGADFTVRWLPPDGGELGAEQWAGGRGRALAIHLRELRVPAPAIAAGASPTGVHGVSAAGEGADVDGFLSFSLSVQNRRKSRAGQALENHLEAMFRAHDLRFARGVETENRNKPDFLFPGQTEYAVRSSLGRASRRCSPEPHCQSRWAPPRRGPARATMAPWSM